MFHEIWKDKSEMRSVFSGKGLFFNCETGLGDWTIIRYNRAQLPSFDQDCPRFCLFVSFSFLFDVSLPTTHPHNEVVGEWWVVL